jgi:hypothetical protein
VSTRGARVFLHQLSAAHRVAAVAVVALCALAMVDPPDRPTQYDNDQFLYDQTVDRMRDGDGYYEAAAATFKSVGGAVETARAFRPPTAFLVWRWIPEGLLWPGYVVFVCAATGLLLLFASRAAIAVPIVVAYLLALGRVSVEYLFVELWTVPLTAGCLLAHQRRRDGVAAGCALVATAVRELAAPLVAGGLFAARIARRPLRPWAIAAAGGAALYGLHLLLLQDHLSSAGTEQELLGTGSLGAVVDIAGFQLPAGALLGPALWALALAALWRRGRAQVALLGPLMLLPLVGLLVDRPYWGGMVVPFELLLAGELLSSLPSPRGRGARATRA